MQYILINRIWVKLNSNYFNHIEIYKQQKDIRVMNSKEIEKLIQENK